MLTDISNHPSLLSAVPSSPSGYHHASASLPNKRRLLTSEADGVVPSRLKIERNLSSSSSSPARRASSPFFANTRLDAYHASSSPSSSKLNLTPKKRFSSLSSLPPSSPSFALSSSTALGLASDAPDETQSEPLTLRLERGTVLYFGRKAKKAIPRAPSPGFNRVERALPILLPKSAKNASRIHCSARIISDEDADVEGKVAVEIRVTGQNGMKVDGKLWRAGSVARLEVEPATKVMLSFWGWDAQVIVAESEAPQEEDDDEDAFDRFRASSPASSALNSLFDDEDLHDDDDQSEAHSQPAPRRRAAPPSPAGTLSSLSSSPILASVPLSSSASSASSRAYSLASSLSLDLPGLLASSIVFHPRSTVGVDELVRALLKETGSMWDVLSADVAEVERLKETRDGEQEAVDAWKDVVEDVLRDEKMFGMIDNTGLKDAAGQPLAPYYYYIPDLDPSPSRVEALEPFVKRVRGARTAKPVRYFWAKPSLRKNR
ncbi:hypothetical protein JCM1840_002775 [Sporobolomyces johnsonii]